MAWLLRGGDVLASLEVASTRMARRKGLLGRDGIDGALLLERTRWVHTIGMRFPIDVAYVDSDGVVLKVATMRRHRVGLPMPKARSVVEAPAGTFERWKLLCGDRVEVRLL
ncbi:MAG: hypothetical protein JWL70_2887 [Acidimicrobiia bacterium]|nr:hypothetical protein [Acidimicrobiia bacterium]